MLGSTHIFGVALFFLCATALPAAESGYDDTGCLSSWQAYDSSTSSWNEAAPTQVISETVYSSAYGGVLDRDVPYTTLCDGRPRALLTRYTTPYTTYDPPLTVTKEITPQHTGLAPTCTVPESACTAILSSYSSALSEWQTNDAPSPTNRAHCTTYLPCSSSPNYCFIYAGAPQLYYWPVTKTSGDFCAYNGSTIFAEPTNPPLPDTVVRDGYTFTSPTSYISMDYAVAYIQGRRPQRTQCGTTSLDNIIVPLTETLSSLAGSQSFNFQDLNTVPVGAYERQRKCINGRDCTTIEGEYTPIIQLPTEILNLQQHEGKDAGCRGTAEGYYVTPIALITPAPRLSKTG